MNTSGVATAASRAEIAIGETTISLPSSTGWRGWLLKRPGPNNAQWHLQLSASELENAATLLARLEKFSRKSREIKLDLWLLGRSYLAPSERDSLFEAVIALESVLLANMGESTYKVRLHGSAVLSAVGVFDVQKDLVDIYAARSKVAHAGVRKSKEFGVLTSRSRIFTALAVLGTLELDDSGDLKLEANGDIGKAVTEMVFRRALRSAAQ